MGSDIEHDTSAFTGFLGSIGAVGYVVLWFILVNFAISFYLVNNVPWRFFSSIGMLIISLAFLFNFIFQWGYRLGVINYEPYSSTPRYEFISYGEGFFIYLILIFIFVLSSLITFFYEVKE